MRALSLRRKQPTTRMGWANYYIGRYCKHGHSQAEHLALWLLILHEAFGETNAN